MPTQKKIHPQEKASLHPRNRHRERYDFKVLIDRCPELSPFVQLNPYGDLSIDFFNPDAVKALNKALLNYFYGMTYWDIPKNYLCPAIPGRADYIHHIADLLGDSNHGKIPTGSHITCLDIGVGANCVYPIIGNKEYGWSFIGADIDPIAIQSANKIIQHNPALIGQVEVRLQKNLTVFFHGIIQQNEKIDVTICNPPFHTSLKEAEAGTRRKLTNLTGKKANQVTLNFAGKNNELWCDGGEKIFIRNMIRQSIDYANSCLWFSTLIAKKDNLDSIYLELKKSKAVDVKTMMMGQGNKISRLIAWTFLSKEQRERWVTSRWSKPSPQT